MKTWLMVCLASWLVACTVATTNQTNANDAFADMDWVDVMQDLNGATKDLSRWLLKRPQGDLREVAGRAQRAADQMRMGYGRFEDEQVPTFAQHARDAESWLVKIAIEARQGHGEIAAELYRTGRGTHCVDCHDAMEEAANDPAGTKAGR